MSTHGCLPGTIQYICANGNCHSILEASYYQWCFDLWFTSVYTMRKVTVHSYHMWPTEQKPGTSRKYWIWVRRNFICTGRFPTKLRLLHQGVTGGLHCIVLNYDIQLCYYKDTISLNSQAGQWNTGVHCYGQLKHAFQKRQFHKLPACMRLSFCL